MFSKSKNDADSLDARVEELDMDNLDPAVVKRIVRKFDMRVLPCLVIMYFMNYLDRQNVAAARLKGLQRDLNLDGLQYSNVINLFFVTYIAVQIPASYALAFVKYPTYYITSLMALWGLVSLLTAEAKGYGSILAIRLVIVSEGFSAVLQSLADTSTSLPSNPPAAALFTMSKFYTRSELALRSGFFYGSALLASAFGSLLAAGIIAGIGPERYGIAGWRFLFYIEGAATIGLAIIIAFVLPNFPATAPFLTPSERLVAVRRLQLDTGKVDEDDPNVKWWQPLLQAFSDPVIYLLALVWWLVTAGLAFNSYSPTLTASLDLGGSTISLLLTAPPFILALIVELINCYHSDATRERSLHITWPLVVAIIGCIIPLATTQKAARYVGIFLMTLAYGGYPVILGWVQVSFPGKPKRRAAAIGFLAAFANTANIAGGYFFVSSKYGPTYRTSFALVLAMFAAAIVATLGTRFYLKFRNRQLDRLEREGVVTTSGALVDKAAEANNISTAQAEALSNKFRYFT